MPALTLTEAQQLHGVSESSLTEAFVDCVDIILVTIAKLESEVRSAAA